MLYPTGPSVTLWLFHFVPVRFGSVCREYCSMAGRSSEGCDESLTSQMRIKGRLVTDLSGR